MVKDDQGQQWGCKYVCMPRTVMLLIAFWNIKATETTGQCYSSSRSASEIEALPVRAGMNSCQLMSSIGPRQSAVHGVVCMIVLQSLTVGKGCKCTCLLPFFSQTNSYN